MHVLASCAARDVASLVLQPRGCGTSLAAKRAFSVNVSKKERFICTESLKYDWGDVTAVFSRSRRYHSPERAPKIKYFMSKNMKIIPRKDPRLPPSWTLLGEAPKSDKNRGLHFLCKKGGKKLQYFGLPLEVSTPRQPRLGHKRTKARSDALGKK